VLPGKCTQNEWLMATLVREPKPKQRILSDSRGSLYRQQNTRKPFA
jgi:hypothetical protein